eukprot:998615-Prymnesium_polylepis.1
MEPHLLDEIGPRGRRVAGDALLGLATEQVVDGLVLDLPEQIPERDVDGGDGVHGEALARVVDRGAPHLLPDVRDVAHALALHEHGEVLLYHEARRFAAGGGADADQAVGLLHLHHDRWHARHAPRAAALAVPREACHRIRDRRMMRRLAHDPVRVGRVVDVAGTVVTRAAHKGADGDDDRLAVVWRDVLVEAEEERRHRERARDCESPHGFIHSS